MENWNILVVLAILLLGACSPKTVDSPASEVPPSVEIASSEQVVTGESQTVQDGGIQLTQGNLSLTIFSPVDNSIVTTSQVEVSGTTNTETVLTINGLLCLLPANREFSFPVDLTEGYNMVELVASDYDGNQVELVLTVIYES